MPSRNNSTTRSAVSGTIVHSSSPSFTYWPPGPTFAATRYTVPSQGATMLRALNRSMRLSISWISRSTANRLCSAFRRLLRATAMADKPAASAWRSRASCVSRPARARWISASALSMSVWARSARIWASSRESRLSRPPNCGFLNRSSKVSKRLLSKFLANCALDFVCWETSIVLRAASRFASAAFTAASRADSWAAAAAVNSVTSLSAASSRPVRNFRCSSSRRASSGSLSSISTTGSFIFTRLPSMTCQFTIWPATRAVSTCIRSVGEYAVTTPRHITVCCQGTKARRNGVTRKARRSRRAAYHTYHGVAARASADLAGRSATRVSCRGVMTTPPLGRSGP